MRGVGGRDPPASSRAAPSNALLKRASPRSGYPSPLSRASSADLLACKSTYDPLAERHQFDRKLLHHIGVSNQVLHHQSILALHALQGPLEEPLIRLDVDAVDINRRLPIVSAKPPYRLMG